VPLHGRLAARHPATPLWDLKTTGGRAIPRVWARSCFEDGYDLQAAFYSRGAAEVRDGEMPQGMRYCVIENKAPHGIRVFELTPAAYEMAEAQVGYALDLWRRCMQANCWPSYPIEPEWIDAPPWMLRDWEWKTRTGAGLRAGTPTLSPVARNTMVVQRMIETGNLAGETWKRLKPRLTN
jgi:PDDEXK-like domain of unknown function (DUF3799)